jgi:RHS repeat-associated protein
VGNGSEHEIGSYQGVSYGYYGDRRLASVSGPGGTYNLAYDGLGRTVQRSLNGVTTYYVYDGEKPIYEYKADGSTAGWNVYGKGIDEPLMRADYVAAPGGQGYFYQQDHEGSVTHLTGWGGEVIESYRYDAFGAPTTTYSAGNFNNRFKFTGREYLPQFGIYEYRNRAYHPGLGRFMSEDPSGFSAGDYNLFRYCGNDPVDRTDPTGLVSNPTDILKPNLIITGQGDWTRLGSAFTNGDLQSMVRNYLGQLQSAVDSYVNKANEASQKAGGSVTWVDGRWQALV